MSVLERSRERHPDPPSLPAGAQPLDAVILARLLDAVEVGAFHVDAAGVIRSWNRAASELTGFAPAEIVGCPLARLYPGADGEERADGELREARRTGRHEVNGWRVQRDDRRVWAHSVITSIGAAGFAVVLGRRRFGFLDQVSSMLAGTLDPSVALVNLSRLVVPYLADFCAVDLVDEGRPLRRAAFAHVDGAREALLSANREASMSTGEAPARVLRTGRSELITEITPERLSEVAGGEEEREALETLEPGSMLLVPLTARGRVLGVITMATGPDRRYAPEDQAMAEELARRAGVALDNARLHEEAREAVRARDEFLSVASHELKTPLTTVQIHVQMLLRSIRRGDADPLVVARKLGSAEEQVRRLGKLMDELLDTSRITAGRLELDRRPVRLDELVREVVTRHEDELALAGIELHTHMDRVDGSWDRGRMEQVITNLLSNAIKYAASAPVEITLTRVHRRAVLAVRDHGAGIPREDQARIFDRFQRATTGRPHAGLGLGLFIVRQIVAAHGGTIQVVSEPGSGSTFIVVLPTEASSG